MSVQVARLEVFYDLLPTTILCLIIIPCNIMLITAPCTEKHMRACTLHAFDRAAVSFLNSKFVETLMSANTGR